MVCVKISLEICESVNLIMISFLFSFIFICETCADRQHKWKRLSFSDRNCFCTEKKCFFHRQKYLFIVSYIGNQSLYLIKQSTISILPESLWHYCLVDMFATVNLKYWFAHLSKKFELCLFTPIDWKLSCVLWYMLLS